MFSGFLGFTQGFRTKKCTCIAHVNVALTIFDREYLCPYKGLPKRPRLTTTDMVNEGTGKIYFDIFGSPEMYILELNLGTML